MYKIKYIINNTTWFYFSICFLIGFRFITMLHSLLYQSYPLVIPDKEGLFRGIICLCILIILGIFYYKLLFNHNPIKKYFFLISIITFILGFCAFLPFPTNNHLYYYK